MTEKYSVLINYSDQNTLDKILRELLSQKFEDIQYVKMQSSDELRILLDRLHRLKNEKILFIDIQNNPYIFDYSYIKKLSPDIGHIFLKYESPVSSEMAIGMKENGALFKIPKEDLDQWSDCFGLAGAVTLKKDLMIKTLSKAPNLGSFFDEVLKIAVGVPVPVLKKNLKPCLFLDRDGIINEDPGYLSKPEQLKFMPGIFDLIRWAKRKGWYVVVVSNQSGLSRGKLTSQELVVLTDSFKKKMALEHAAPDAWFYCPYFPDGNVKEFSKNSVSRKPLPGMLLQAASNLPIDFERSFMIGDKDSDRIVLMGLHCLCIQGRYKLNVDKENVFANLRDALSYLEKKTGDGVY